MGQRWPAAVLGALSVAVCERDLFKEVHNIFITSTIVWPHIKQQGGNIAPPINKNWIKDLLSMAPPIRRKPSFPFNQSLPSRSFHKPLILIHQRADRLKTTITELTKLITWTTALSNSMKLSHAVCGHPRCTGHGGEF